MMPHPVEGCSTLKDVFVDNIFKGQEKAWEYTTAISGAHTLGAAKMSMSGFNGYWSDSENQGKFNNDYYKAILTKGWQPELRVNGVEGKN